MSSTPKNNTLDTILRFYNSEMIGLIYCIENELNTESEDYFNLYYLTNGLIKNHLELNQNYDQLIITKFFNKDTFIKVFNLKNIGSLVKNINSIQKALPQLFKERKTMLIRTHNSEAQKKIEQELRPALKNLNIEIKLVI